jgi:hypothetical protein
LTSLDVLPSAARETRSLHVAAVWSNADDPAFVLLVSGYLRVESEESPVVVVRRVGVRCPSGIARGVF